MNQQLSIERLGLLLRADLMLRARNVLIVSATLAGLIVIHGTLTTAFGNPQTNIFPAWFYGSLFVWGAVAASYSFPELHNKSTNQAYLLLPASALEKTLSRLFIVTVLFWPFLSILLTLASWLNAGVSLILFGARVPVFSAAEYLSWPIFGHAVVVQSVYFLGAAWFRKAHFLKTALATTLITNAFFIITGIILWVLYRDMIAQFGPGGVDEGQIMSSNRVLLDLTMDFAPALYFFVLPPFCWWVAWLRVRETQVSYGV